METWYSKEYFTQKYPAETGYFYKDIIVGHISSVEIANKKNILEKFIGMEKVILY